MKLPCFNCCISQCDKNRNTEKLSHQTVKRKQKWTISFWNEQKLTVQLAKGCPIWKPWLELSKAPVRQAGGYVCQLLSKEASLPGFKIFLSAKIETHKTISLYVEWCQTTWGSGWRVLNCLTLVHRNPNTIGYREENTHKQPCMHISAKGKKIQRMSIHSCVMLGFRVMSLEGEC